MMRLRRFAVLLLILAIALPLAARGEKERQGCHVCGMWIDQYMKTRHVAIHKDGHSVNFCSIACTSKYLLKHGGDVVKVLAADYLSRELVEAHKAVYLSGSDVFGVMTYTSRLAFSDKGRAAKFQKEHGGHIIDFQKALEELRAE